MLDPGSASGSSTTLDEPPIAYPSPRLPQYTSTSSSFFVSGSPRPSNQRSVWSNGGGSSAARLQTESQCICCGTRVRYARSSAAYRCSSCDTIVDLKPRIDLELGSLSIAGSSDDMTLPSRIRKAFRSLDSLNEAFSVDSKISPFYESVIGDPEALQQLRVSTLALIARPGVVPSGGNWIIALLECPLLSSMYTPEYTTRTSMIARVLGLLAQLSVETHHSLVTFYGHSFPTATFSSRVEMLISFLSSRILMSGEDYAEDWRVVAASRITSLFFAANSNRAPHEQIPVTTFYCSAIDILDQSGLCASFEGWEAQTDQFSLCQYPFLISLGSKLVLLRYEYTRSMEESARAAARTYPSSPAFLHLTIRRSHIVNDSLHQLSESHDEMKKALRITFQNEPGIDYGGVRKEWFLLLIRQLFDRQFGMFLYDDVSRLCWFNPADTGDSEEDGLYLLGAVVGLALYTSTNLDIPLPLAIYKKLCGEILSLEDLAEVQPDLARGLATMLREEVGEESTFFVATYLEYGEPMEVLLLAGGDEIKVTDQNKAKFVDLYVQWYLSLSVATHYDRFEAGFYDVAEGNGLAFLTATELELLIRGDSQPLATEDLQSYTDYDNLDPDETTSLLFWQTVDSLDESQRRRLLSFVTGTDRLPISGGLRIKLSCLGEDLHGRLPTTRTCFNQLNLYRYRDYETMRARLVMAMEGSEGFDLR